MKKKNKAKSPVIHVATLYVCPKCQEFFTEEPNYRGACPECGFKPKGKPKPARVESVGVDDQ